MTERELDAADLIAELRGGYPEKCDFCDKPSEQYVPEEAGQWACIECWNRWAKEECQKAEVATMQAARRWSI